MGRAPCCDKANVKKGPWSPEEDAKLKSYIEKHGTGGNWIALPQKIGLKRCGKSCRLRWLNYLRPNIKHGGFSEEEDKIILSLYVSIGSRWSIIAAQLPGRTDNDIKNYWNTRLKKKFLGKQRRDQQQHKRKANNNIMIKQEDNIKVDPISFTSSSMFNNNNNQIPFWSPQFVTLPSTISSIPNYSNSSESLYNINDHTSIRKLLMNVGGHYYDHNNNIICPNNVITQTNNNNNNNNNNHHHHLSSIPSSEMITNSTFHDLEELMSSNTQMMVSDGLEYLYGDCGNYLEKNNEGSTSDITNCGDNSLGWGDQMSSLVYLPKLEPNHNIQQRVITPMPSNSCLDEILVSGIGEEGSLEENFRYPSDDL